jgi:trans-o-hydroxybenzylidenepyruvate hydratase-aldolase
MLSSKDIRGLYAILPTPAKPGANRIDALDTVDLDETERMLNALISDGATGIIALGTTGECATLSRPDYDAFASCVIEVVGRRVPTFIGTSALGGHEVASRMKFVRDCGADGTLLGLPMWQPLSDTAAIDFYRELSLCFNDLAIMVYANARAFRYAFPQQFWEAVAQQAPTVIAAKLSRPKDLGALVACTGGRINIMPNEMTVHDFFRISPDTTTACWATAASMAPSPLVRLMDAVLAKDSATINAMAVEIAWANEPVAPIFGSPEVFALYNIQLEKTRINEAGYCNSGPIRPPYDEFPEAYAEASRECGRRWATLQRKYAGADAGRPH